MDTKNKKRRQFEIIDGPNKDALFDACKYAYNSDSTIAIDFTVAIGYTMPKSHPDCACVPMSITDVRIVGIEHEDGSGESFNLEGYCKADPDSSGRINPTASYKFTAYYDARKRRGGITLID